MPWHTETDRPECDGVAVVKDDDGSVSGCHDTLAEAEAQVEALYAADEERIVAALITAEQRREWAEEGIALPDGSYPIPNREFLRKAIGALGRAAQNDEYERVRRHIIKRARALNALDELPGDWDVSASGNDYEEEDEPVRAGIRAAAAKLAPETPPAEWFQNPRLSGPSPMIVTPQGRVYGHAALWDTCHVGVEGMCRTPPHSASGYDYFLLGERETTGGPVRVGRITLGTGHASMNASRRQAVEHYDNTGTVVAHVTAGEDAHGIWVAGALDPDADAARVRTFRAASVSGDWRDVNGNLEMVGLLAVNVPGYPIPRAEARVAGGMIAALVGAGQVDTLLSDADYERRLRLLAARALGEQELIDMALGTTREEKRMRTMRGARPVAAAPEETGPHAITININVGGEEPVVLPQLTAAQEREVGMQVDFFRIHGYWPDEQLGGGILDPVEMQPVMAAALQLVKRPDRTVELRQRLIDQGYIIDAGVTAA